ncbi:mitochondrial cardiolipin hydrolase [Orcinus orca]|uniref:mitochondrial cardiolipin hydrolase n=2 Tax=Delphinidae TaxID=9726 RepID=UPI0021117694|nr:mitochondrial cardiolipin hydrolase [Orcinus orca]
MSVTFLTDLLLALTWTASWAGKAACFDHSFTTESTIFGQHNCRFLQPVPHWSLCGIRFHFSLVIPRSGTAGPYGRPLTTVASPLRTRRLSGHGSRAQPLRGMWGRPGPGHNPASPASAGGFLTTALPGKPLWVVFGCLLGPLGVGCAGAVWAGARRRQAGAQAQWAMGAESAGVSAPGRRAHVARGRRAHRRSGRWALNAQAQVGGRQARRRSGQRAHVVGGASDAKGEMGPLRWQVVAAVVGGLALALEALPAVLRWLWAGRRPPRREVLFFPSQVTCTEALLRVPGTAPSGCPCNLPHGESSLSRLLRALLAARASLELCLFAFSSPQLGRAVQLLHQRGVRVRVVTDCDYMALSGSQIGLLRKAGIQVRHDQDLGYMHHKFAIVDKKVLITGSLNWTTQAIQSNRENVLIIEDEECVRLFLEEFERIWEEFNPTKYTFFPHKKGSR